MQQVSKNHGDSVPVACEIPLAMMALPIPCGRQDPEMHLAASCAATPVSPERTWLAQAIAQQACCAQQQHTPIQPPQVCVLLHTTAAHA